GLEVLAAAVDAKASFREHHGEAVTEMVRELAETAGLPAGDREIYEVAARLHDVGKVGIPAEILEKGDRLTDDDRRDLQRHVELGVDIFTNAEAPGEFVEIVRHHHERWDGKGYPNGLKGDEIPLGARLIAICDSFQAMLSDRPYRAALPLEEARAEIRRGAGVQFDPTLAGLFLDRCRTSGATVGPTPASAETALGARGADASPPDKPGTAD
ncbi:MAG: HD-GYP domain-containing protein, partial [Thermoleophilia bacterium]